MYITLAQGNQAQLLSEEARCTIEDLFLEWRLKVGQAKLAKDIWKFPPDPDMVIQNDY